MKKVLLLFICNLYLINVIGQINLDVDQDARINGVLFLDSTLRVGYIVTQPNGDSTSVFIGLRAGINDDGTSNDNVFIGRNAGRDNISGSENIFIGEHAGQHNTSGSANVSIGDNAGRSNTTASNNTIIGLDAGWHNFGEDNTFVGQEAGFFNGSGEDNTFIGKYAGRFNTTGKENTFVGERSGSGNKQGSWNTCLGDDAGIAMDTMTFRNTFVGDDAGQNNKGDDNTAVGRSSASATFQFSSSTFLGVNANPGAAVTNSMALGFDAEVSVSNAVVIGNNLVSSIGGFADWSNISDKRFKKNIGTDVPGLDFILALEPVSYQMDYDHMNTFTERDNIPSQRHIEEVHTGFLAQDVAALVDDLNVSFSGVDHPDNAQTPYSLRYAQFVVPLVKALQEQQQQINDLKELNTLLEASLTELAYLKVKVEQFEILLTEIVN